MDDLFLKYANPIIVDNSKFREKIPGYNKYFDKVKHELSVLPKENNVIVDNSFVEFVSCDVCGGVKYRQLFVKYGFSYAICEDCNHVYVKNRLKENIIIEDYKVSEIEDASHAIEKTEEIQEYANQLYKKYLSLFNDLGVSKGELLDIGCGSGNFVSYCKDNSHLTLFGLELNEKQHPKLKNILGNENLFSSKIEDSNFGDQKFKIITLWGVLEHLVSPVSVLSHCMDVLENKGYVLCLIPNIYSRAFEILGIRNPTLNPKVHLQMYTKESFSQLCKMTGLKIVKRFCELPVIDLMYEHINYNAELVNDIVRREESYYYVYLLQKI
jgi:2-polyprenyl-3-methyl-5-hydroxy-6-metoxy-1,4-benzoquinol methylase